MEINNGISTIDLPEKVILNILEDKKVIDSILLMLINNEDSFENGNEVEFPRSEATGFLEIYFAQTNYSKKYIKKTLKKLG